MELEIKNPIEFDWDSGNKNKSLLKHGITNNEAEEVFVNFNLIWPDEKHSDIEDRLNILGESDNRKLIISCYTVRNFKIRIISSRLASRKERISYEKAFKENA